MYHHFLLEDIEWKTGDLKYGKVREAENEKFGASICFSINDDRPELNSQRERFENLTPIFPNKKIVLEK